jgi:hypothetical protein
MAVLRLYRHQLANAKRFLFRYRKEPPEVSAAQRKETGVAGGSCKARAQPLSFSTLSPAGSISSNSAAVLCCPGRMRCGKISANGWSTNRRS